VQLVTVAVFFNFIEENNDVQANMKNALAENEQQPEARSKETLQPSSDKDKPPSSSIGGKRSYFTEAKEINRKYQVAATYQEGDQILNHTII
jgi:hypothetical protein